MGYDVGTHIDLSWVNQKPELIRRVPRKDTWPSRRLRTYDVGTSFVFQLTRQGVKTAIKIPVAFA